LFIELTILFCQLNIRKFTHGPTNSTGAEDRERRNVPKSNQRRQRAPRSSRSLLRTGVTCARRFAGTQIQPLLASDGEYQQREYQQQQGDPAAPCSGTLASDLGHGGRERLPARSEEPVEEMEQGDGGGRGAARLGLRAQAPLEDVQRWRRCGEATRREGRGQARVRRWVGFWACETKMRDRDVGGSHLIICRRTRVLFGGDIIYDGPSQTGWTSQLLSPANNSEVRRRQVSYHLRIQYNAPGEFLPPANRIIMR
jgi:hypothetical protein